MLKMKDEASSIIGASKTALYPGDQDNVQAASFTCTGCGGQPTRFPFGGPGRSLVVFFVTICLLPAEMTIRHRIS